MVHYPVVGAACTIVASLFASADLAGCSSDGDHQGSTGPVASSVTAAEVADYVDAIDAVRAAVSQPPNYNGSWTPLPKVTWSDPVAAAAQGWANHLASKGCGLEHESQSTYGENLAMGTNLTPQGAVAMWASEKSKYTWSDKYSVSDFNQGSGHYTQLVWRSSIQVGCGTAACGNSVVISCRFLPAGNQIGSPVY